MEMDMDATKTFNETIERPALAVEAKLESCAELTEVAHQWIRNGMADVVEAHGKSWGWFRGEARALNPLTGRRERGVRAAQAALMASREKMRNGKGAS
jgi:hypothetical protein